MDLSPGEALFEARLAPVLAQGPAPLHVVYPDRPVLVELGPASPMPQRPPRPSTGPPSWATSEERPVAAADGMQQGSPAQGDVDGSPERGDVSEARPNPSVARLQAVGLERSVADAALLEAIGGVVAAVRARLLQDKGLVGVELGRGQERSLDAEVRRAAVAEVEVALGFGVTEAQALVGLAAAAGDLREVVLEALRRGDATWPMIRVFWESSSRLSDTQRMLVAMALYGQDPGLACEERLGCDGDLLSRPWGDGSYRAACEREIRACEGTDVAGERERRRRAYARRRASVRVHDDGTATLSVTGPAVTVAAVHQRIDRIARLLRGAGDERNLDNLRCDTINSLLLYGTIDFPDPVEPVDRADESDEAAADTDTDHADTDAQGDAADPHDDAADAQGDADDWHDELVSPEALAEIARVVNAQPLVQVQVVVPHAVLGNSPPICASCAGTITPGAPPGPAGDANLFTPGEPTIDDPPSGVPGRGLVGEVLGRKPFFLAPGHARELALLPGTTLHRLVVDPLDGRLVERSVTAYRPDADMRRQVVAADVYSRAPGARTGSHACELDHVVPYGWAGGQTSEVNLALLGKSPHRLKTLKVWRVAVGERRDLTFTTLLGQIVRTRAHNYRQYLHARDADDLEDRRDIANRAIYATLADRPEHKFRRRPDAWLSLTHTDERGAVRQGPPPHPETLDHVLGPVDDRDATDHPD